MSYNYPSGLYIVGGREKDAAYSKREWHQYGSGVIRHLDVGTGRFTDCVDYVSPPEVVPGEDPSVLFKAGTAHGDRLYICTQTEVLIFRIPDFEQVGYVSLPCFNDLHHVRVSSRGTLLVAVTGLDMVVELSENGDVVHEWDVLGDAPWTRFSRDVDYRKVPTTKPHRAHPNYVFEFARAIWATRFEQGDAVCLEDHSKTIKIGFTHPHDGVVFGDSVVFTDVSGHLIFADPHGHESTRVVNLNEVDDNRRPLGWCRGLIVLDEDLVVVGFSRLRPSRIRKNLKWIVSQFGAEHLAGAESTRVACYDLKAMRQVWSFNTEPAGLNTIFSLHAAV